MTKEEVSKLKKGDKILCVRNVPNNYKDYPIIGKVYTFLEVMEDYKFLADYIMTKEIPISYHIQDFEMLNEVTEVLFSNKEGL